jgi:hypothetical protein
MSGYYNVYKIIKMAERLVNTVQTYRTTVDKIYAEKYAKQKKLI